MGEIDMSLAEVLNLDAEIRTETSASLASWNPETLTGLVAVHYDFPEGYYQADDPIYFSLNPEPSSGIVFGDPLKAEPIFKNGLAEYHEETTMLIEFRASRNSQVQRLAINALFRLCNFQGTCLFPDSELQYVDFDPLAPTLEPSETTLAILDWSTSEEGILPIGANTPPNAGFNEGDTTSIRVFLILLMALVGGALLNIMPCILPLLSVKALNLVNQAGQSRRAIFMHSVLYVAGIETSLLALATIVIALRTSGHLLGWGFQLQSPLFVLILIAIIWIFALSLFDVFVIEAPRRSRISDAGKKGGFGGSFITGLFAVLIAAPCTAPLLGVVLGFAFSQEVPMTIAIFALIGLGFGSPFLLLGFGLANKFPKPGPWMNTFKEAMGFLLIGFAVYLFTTFIKLVPTAVNGAIWWLLFLGISAWLLGKARGLLVKRALSLAGQILALVIAIVSGFLFVDLPNADLAFAEQNEVELSWRLGETKAIAFNEQELQSFISKGRPVFLEFSADWCTTCKINQRVLRHEEILDLMTRKGITHIKADLTSYDENLVRALADYNRASLPLYVLYRPGEEGPYIFPIFITVKKLQTEMMKIQ